MKIYTFVNNKPDLLELQLKSFRRHLREPFEFIVVDNSYFGASGDSDQICRECRRLQLPVTSVKIDQSLAARYEQDSREPVLSGIRYTNMTIGCGYGVQWAWNKVITKDKEKVLLMHHDMFLMQPTVLSDYLTDAALMFVPQVREGIPVHLWEGFALFNMKTLPDPTAINWSHGVINGVRTDVGGMSHLWFQSHPDVNWKGIRPVHTEDTPEVDFHPALFEYLHFDDKPLVLHYRAASDWMKMGKEYHDRKTNWLRRQLA